MLAHLKIIRQFHFHPMHQKVSRFFGPRYIEFNTGESTRQGNLRHPRIRFQSFSLRGLPSQRTIVILPKGVGDFPILYLFRCLILFLTKDLIVFVYISSSVFPQPEMMGTLLICISKMATPGRLQQTISFIIACVSFSELENDTLNQAELNEIKINENN